MTTPRPSRTALYTAVLLMYGPPGPEWWRPGWRERIGDMIGEFEPGRADLLKMEAATSELIMHNLIVTDFIREYREWYRLRLLEGPG